MSIVKNLMRSLSRPELDESTKTLVRSLNFYLYRTDKITPDLEWFFYDIQRDSDHHVNVALQIYASSLHAFNYNLVLETGDRKLQVQSSEYLRDSSGLPITRGCLDNAIRIAEEIRWAGYETTINGKPLDTSIKLFSALDRNHVGSAYSTHKLGNLFHELMPA